MSSPRSTHSPTRYRLSRTVLCEAYASIADTWCAMAAGLSGQSHRGIQPRPISAIGRSILLCCTLSVLAQRCGNLRPSVRTEAYEAARVHYAPRRGITNDAAWGSATHRILSAWGAIAKRIAPVSGPRSRLPIKWRIALRSCVLRSQKPSARSPAIASSGSSCAVAVPRHPALPGGAGWSSRSWCQVRPRRPRAKPRRRSRLA
jgi:hypothetical protein